MMLALIALAIVAADPVDAPSPPAGAPLRVVVLAARSADLSARESALIASLVSMRLEKNTSYEVLSELALDDTAKACATTACLADVAASMRADYVLFAATESLGDALVLTLYAYDASHRKLVRDAVSARERGELPDRLALLVDGVMAPLLAHLPAERRPDVRAGFDQIRVDVCSDERGWYFCDTLHHGITENDFVRRYRAETNRHDLDRAETDRNPSLEPWIFLGVGSAVALATVTTTVIIGGTDQGQAFARQSDDAWIVLPVLGLSTSLALLVYGAVELDDT
ncbi:MAG TPA: hypothetical protein VGO62_00310, partial [Myxococcota bacterium]